MNRRNQRHGQRGASIVEFVIIFPILILIFYLLVELGVAHINQTVLTHAARAAAREAGRTTDATKSLQRQQAVAEGVLQSLILWYDSASTRQCGVGAVTCNFAVAPPGGTVAIGYGFQYRLLNALGMGLSGGLQARATFPNLTE